MLLNFDMRHGALVTRQGHKSHSDMRHVHFLNSTGDMGKNKRPTQRESVEYRLRWIPNAKFLRWPCTFLFVCADFIRVGSRF